MNLEFYIDGKFVREPVEYRSLELELNFEDPTEIKTAISSEKFTWVNENADILKNYLATGITGGSGVFYGVPLEIKVNGLTLFNGYIDLTNDAEFSCAKVITKVREAKNSDWMDEIADGFSFDLLYQRGIITDADFIKMPYIVSDIPDYKGAALFLISAYVIGREIVTTIKNIIDVISLIGGYLSIIAGVLQLIFLIVYLVILIIALVKLIKAIMDELIQPIKYHLGMMVETHFIKACEYLGLTFSSSILQAGVPTGSELTSGDYSNMLLLPEKNKAGFKKNKTAKQKGYFNGTFGDLIRAFEGVLNAKHIIIGNVFHFERRDFGSSTEVYNIPDVRKEFYGINADEMISNYLIQFQIDSLDLNTVNRYKGTNVKNFITHKNADPTKSDLIKGFKQPSIPFALGRRKDTLTDVEILVDKFLKAIDKLLTPVYTAIDAVLKVVNIAIDFINKVIKALNTIGVKIPLIKKPAFNVNKKSLASIMSGRIGMLTLSNDMFSIPKVVLITGSGWEVKVATDNETKLSALKMWEKFHYIESFVPSTNKPAANQSYKWNIPVIPFCIESYYKIRGLNNNNQGEARIITPENNPAKLLSLKWNVWQDTAAIKYKENKLYDNNLTEILIENQGE